MGRIRKLTKRLPALIVDILRLCYQVTHGRTTIGTVVNKIRYISDRQKNSLIKFVPPVFNITISDQCNMRCPNCYHLLIDENRFFHSYIEVDKFREVLYRYRKQHAGEVVFLSGGEPLMHPKFTELVEICLRYGMLPRLSTNGILVSRFLDVLCKLDIINVSLDSYDYESFKRYRGGTMKQFEEVQNSLSMLKNRGIHFTVSFVISKENISELGKMLDFAMSFEPDAVHFLNIEPHEDARFDTLIRQDAESMQHIEKVLDRNDFSMNIYFSHIFDIDSAAFRETKCMQPWTNLCFNSTGDMSLCCKLPPSAEVGNIFQGDDSNSQAMIKFRTEIVHGNFPDGCIFCHRRFPLDDYFATFDSKRREWTVKPMASVEGELIEQVRRVMTTENTQASTVPVNIERRQAL